MDSAAARRSAAFRARRTAVNRARSAVLAATASESGESTGPPYPRLGVVSSVAAGSETVALPDMTDDTTKTPTAGAGRRSPEWPATDTLGREI